MSTCHLRLYDGAGALLCLLPEFTVAEASEELGVGEGGAWSAELPAGARNREQLEQLLDGQLGVWLDGQEVYRGLYDDDGDDDADPDAPLQVSGRGLMAVLERALVYPQGGVGTTPASHSFVTATAGGILGTLLTLAQARGGLPGLTWTFTATHDSNGVPFSKALTVTYDAQVTYLQVASGLQGQGVVELRMVGTEAGGYELQAYEPDTELARDMPGVVLHLGREGKQLPRQRSRREIASHVLVVGDEGANAERANATTLAAYGRREVGLSQGNTTEAATMAVLGDAVLADRAQPKLGRTLEYDLAAGGPRPWLDYRVGDRIRVAGVRTAQGQLEPLRVRTMAASWDADGMSAPSVELGDLFLEATVRLARRIEGITNGSVITAAGGLPDGTEPPPGTDTLAPAAPTAVTLVSSAYQLGDGTTLANAAVSWAAVTTNTDASPLTDLDRYEVALIVDGQLRANQSAALLTSFHFGALRPGASVQAYVHAIDTAGNRSAYAVSAVVVLAGDTTAPPQPAAPTLTTGLGIVRASWTGLGSAGEPMPPDFARAEVHVSAAGAGFVPDATTRVDVLEAPGVVAPLTNLAYGTDVWVKLVAVDRTGNASAPSAASGPVRPEQVDLSDLPDNLVTAAKIAAGAVTAVQLAADAVTEAKLATDAVSARVLAAGAVDAGALAAGAVTAVAIAADAVTEAKLATDAVSARVLGPSAVDAAAIAAEAVTEAKLATDAVNGRVLAAGAVDAPNLVANAVTAVAIAAGAVEAGKIAANAVTAATIAAGAVTAGKIAADAVTANEIAANAVTAAELAAGAVTAGKIAAGAVTAGTVAAGAITAAQLTVGALGDSLIPNGSFEDLGTSIDNPDGNGSPLNAARWSGVASGGCSSYTEAGTRGSGARYAVLHATGPGVEARITTDYIPVSKSQTYFFSAGAVQTSGAAGGFYLRVYWYKEDKSSSAITAYADVAANVTLPTALAIVATTPGHLTTGQLTAPADAAYCAVRFYNSAPSLDTYIIVDDVQMRAVVVSAQIGNGAVTAGKVAADAITANEIAAGAVTANELAANAVVAGKVAAGAVTAGTIAAGVVTAAEIAANAVTSEKITVGGLGSTLLRNGSFEDPLAGTWAVTLVGAGASAGVRASTTGASGAQEGYVTVPAVGYPTNYASLASTPFPVNASDVYAITMKAKTSAGVGSSHVYCYIAWYDGPDATGTLISAPAFANVGGGGAPATYTDYTAQMVAPVGARSAAIGLINLGAASTLAFDDVTVRRVVVAAQIADGAITTPKLLAGAVTAATIAAGVIDVTKLAAGTLSAGNISTGTLNADVTVAARIKTADTGARVELAGTGLKSYASDGTTVLVHIDSASGVGTITGGIIQTSSTGTRVVLSNGTTGLQDDGGPDYLRLYNGVAGEAAPGTAYAASENPGGGVRHVVVLKSGIHTGQTSTRVLLKSSVAGGTSEFVVTTGKATFSALLQVNGLATLAGGAQVNGDLTVASGNRYYMAGTGFATNSPSNAGVVVHTNHAGAADTRIGSTTRVYLMSYAGAGYLPVSGGAYTNASSITTKANVRALPLAGALAAVKGLRHVSYTDKVSGTPIGRGLIAEEVQALAPEIVQPMMLADGSTLPGIEQQGLTSLALQAIRELAEQVDRLEARLPAGANAGK